MDRGGAFKGRHFTSEVILCAMQWYLAFPISYRDLASVPLDRGIAVDQTTLFFWVQAYAAKLEHWVRRHLRPCTRSSRTTTASNGCATRAWLRQFTNGPTDASRL